MATVTDRPLDGETITNCHGYVIAGWSCSWALKDIKIGSKTLDDKNRRTEADDASYLCRNINPTSVINCERCGAGFGAGTEALDKDGKVIATVQIGSDYYWRYSKEYQARNHKLKGNFHLSGSSYDEEPEPRQEERDGRGSD
ncbi:hypothetical protein CDV36_007680 [Fusarium kuroshium]|uniref:Uncharacterized protein n=2 Tax=Fusarium solani species complex TaxID=232080 RepID=A0A3M2S521_9HYPO|nr:hypothetical protein CDV36_007680 [Fusarium kuroshium]RSM14212.1 hypothetical protein CEP52_001441 [Fusarium oligoseptatum]